MPEHAKVRAMRPALILAFAVSLAACKGSRGSAVDDDGGTDASIPCGPGGVSKGPWVLAVDEGSAAIRWEACRPATASGVTITPEAGGANVSVDAVETSFDVTDQTTTVLSPNYPDLAGTFYMHEAKVTGLSAATCYAYVLAADPSYKGRFCTARAAGDAIRFMAIGDTNPTLGDNTKNVLLHTLPKNPDFVIHGGDIQYYSSGFETWAGWFPVMQPMLSAGAFFPAIGNHDSGESENPAEYEQYTLRFFGHAGFDGTDSYYRFESGGVWFFSVDTEADLSPEAPEGTWLVQSLGDAAKKPGYRFSIVYFHKPFVTCGDTGDNPGAFAYYAPIFKQLKVPLVFQAHMHGYERFLIDGITYVTSAGGGGLLGNVDGNTSRAYCNQRIASGPWYHAVIADIASAADGGTIHAQAIDRDGQVRDEFQITP
jgi:hypothetical protein